MDKLVGIFGDLGGGKMLNTAINRQFWD